MQKIKSVTLLAAGFVGGVAFLVGYGGGSTSNVAAAATELWQSFSNHIYYTDGNVGIGTNDPQEQLHIGAGQGEIATIKLGTQSLGRNPMVIGNPGGPALHIAMDNQDILNGGRSIAVFRDSGNVGIGTNTPGSKLAVVGLPTSAPDTSGNAGVVCVTKNGNFWLDNDGVADCI